MKTLNVKSPNGHYPIYIGQDILPSTGQYLADLGFQGQCALVTNSTIKAHYADILLNSLSEQGFEPVLCEIPDGEQHKTLATVAGLYDEFLAAGLDRKSPILALGGGVLGDTAGFAAASYLRGVPFVQIPTSLLSMVDASVGGKTGVDLPQGKNLVGAFKQPEMVMIDAQVLNSLDPAEYKSGLAEVLKHGIIAAPHLFEALERNDYTIDWMLAEAIQVKVDVVQEDPFEQGRRATLNLGHTFGHAFEKLANFELRHGEGVAMGIVCAARLATALGYCSAEDMERMIALIAQVGLPVEHPGFDPEAVWTTMGADKKKLAGKIRFILPRAIGDVDIFSDVPKEAVLDVLK